MLKDGVKVKQLSPFLGSIVSGVQVSQLSKEGLDELALFVAERKVVAFRDQDFKDLSPERQIEIARCVSMHIVSYQYVELTFMVQPLRPHPDPPDVWQHRGVPRVPRR